MTTSDTLPVQAAPRRILIDGRAADVIGDDWIEHEDNSTGLNYRFDGEVTVHWIRHGNARLGGASYEGFRN